MNFNAQMSEPCTGFEHKSACCTHQKQIPILHFTADCAERICLPHVVTSCLPFFSLLSEQCLKDTEIPLS